MDAFSEVLSGVRLQGAVFFSAAFSGAAGIRWLALAGLPEVRAVADRGVPFTD